MDIVHVKIFVQRPPIAVQTNSRDRTRHDYDQHIDHEKHTSLPTTTPKGPAPLLDLIVEPGDARDAVREPGHEESRDQS
ncbi:hypothetical protein SAICODRAFT_30655 [Saitoella complicata NRRL Y-17804]|uniref:uncharacterized protein n=1 Tax=Saitoella complicata (strain BCRC 22490 / CBS 7301 / JCM 7358 / NBRC 10748 / NRRL Y-17804) TaxID=698492 RepID=UPI0008679F16|nr:uncharacterized protein SAICODRAFT_30655 [Saitoella complicata NRRL Y-17804]ODQ52514.1 hypothetical protein SAICODRAFT_30655 [Saitoella complicata NRRL Y-17804]